MKENEGVYNLSKFAIYKNTTDITITKKGGMQNCTNIKELWDHSSQSNHSKCICKSKHSIVEWLEENISK